MQYIHNLNLIHGHGCRNRLILFFGTPYPEQCRQFIQLKFGFIVRMMNGGFPKLNKRNMLGHIFAGDVGKRILFVVVWIPFREFSFEPIIIHHIGKIKPTQKMFPTKQHMFPLYLVRHRGVLVHRDIHGH